MSPPCHSCPKCDRSDEKSPEAGRKRDLSRKNRLTLERYYEHLAAPGPVDSIMRKNFGILHEIFATHDRNMQQVLLMNQQDILLMKRML
jgi:hypothetical protein